MISRDIHYGKPTVYNAIEHLKLFLKQSKTSEKIVEVITGYGSSGGTSKIKNEALKLLEKMKEVGYVKDYICGNEIDIFNCKYQNFKYKTLIGEDIKKRRNPGAIYVIL